MAQRDIGSRYPGTQLLYRRGVVTSIAVLPAGLYYRAMCQYVPGCRQSYLHFFWRRRTGSRRLCSFNHSFSGMSYFGLVNLSCLVHGVSHERSHGKHGNQRQDP